MVLRWVAAGVLEAAKGFRRVQGCQDMPALVAALLARDARLGLGESSEDGCVVVNQAAAEFQQRTGHPRLLLGQVHPVSRQGHRAGCADRRSKGQVRGAGEPTGSWVPYEAGVDRVIEELLPWDLQDFFVMDADEAADFVGGSENKIIQRRDVIAKTSFAVSALLGLEIFERATGRVRTISQEFGRAATKAAGDRALSEKQAELDQLRQKAEKLAEKVEKNRHEKADIDDRLERARGRLEALIGSLGAHDQLKERRKENQDRREKADKKRRKAVSALSGEVAAIELLGALAIREVAHVRKILQPLYDDGSIPIRHLVFVQSLLEKGTCVCGQDLTSQSDYRHHVQHIVEQSSGKEEQADYLAQVLHAANALRRHENGEQWESRCADYERTIADLDDEVADLIQTKRDIDSKLDAIDNENVERTRGEIAMIQEQSGRIERELVSDQRSLEANCRSGQPLGRCRLPGGSEGTLRKSPADHAA